MTTPSVFPEDVEVAIVAHDSWSTLPATLDSLVGAGCPLDRITVVDVASGDQTRAKLAEQWPAVRVRPLTRNDGPNPGRNLAFTQGRRRFVLLMDPDVQVAPDTIVRLRNAMETDPTAKVGSPIVVHLTRPEVIQYAGGALHYLCEAVNPWHERPLAERGHGTADIGAAPACALLIDRDAAIQAGLFDERYFLGKDDGDFIHRMRIAGHTILEVPKAIVLHRSRPRGTGLFYYQIRNRWHFILKNYEWRTILCMLPVLLVHEPLQFAVLILKGHGGTYVRALGGLIAMLPALPSDRAFVRRIRRRHDRDLLVTGTLLVRDDLAGGALARSGKALYERALTVYWRWLTRTVLAS
jgi:GT2 family glycosyltransferase